MGGGEGENRPPGTGFMRPPLCRLSYPADCGRELYGPRPMLARGKRGSGRRIRTFISGSKVRGPAIGRSPNGPRLGPERGLEASGSGSQDGESYSESQGDYWLTMSLCIPPRALKSSDCSRAPTLFL